VMFFEIFAVAFRANKKYFQRVNLFSVSIFVSSPRVKNNDCSC
jgi:hypothetical protein